LVALRIISITAQVTKNFSFASAAEPLLLEPISASFAHKTNQPPTFILFSCVGPG
jgi:hypothetical protein